MVVVGCFNLSLRRAPRVAGLLWLELELRVTVVRQHQVLREDSSTGRPPNEAPCLLHDCSRRVVNLELWESANIRSIKC